MFDTKRCPQCNAEMFADMDVCFECMHDVNEGPTSTAFEDAEALPTGQDPNDEQCDWCLRIRSSAVDVTMPVPQHGLIIGRGSSCDVVLHAQPVSRAHVRIERSGTGLVARDLGATNRATVRGADVGDQTPLKPGDVLRVCDTDFEVLASLPA